MLPLHEMISQGKNVHRPATLCTALAGFVFLSACAQHAAVAPAPTNPAVHRLEIPVPPPNAPKEVRLRQADLQRLGDSIVSIKPIPDLILVDKGEIVVASDIHLMALNAAGQVLGRYDGDLSFKVQSGPIKLVAPDSIYAVAVGTSVLTLIPEYLGNSRKTPFPTAKVRIGVKE